MIQQIGRMSQGFFRNRGQRRAGIAGGKVFAVRAATGKDIHGDLHVHGPGASDGSQAPGSFDDLGYLFLGESREAFPGGASAQGMTVPELVQKTRALSNE